MPSWWLQIPWCQIGTRPSVTNITWLWLQLNTDILHHKFVSLQPSNKLCSKEVWWCPTSQFLCIWQVHFLMAITWLICLCWKALNILFSIFLFKIFQHTVSQFQKLLFHSHYTYHVNSHLATIRKIKVVIMAFNYRSHKASVSNWLFFSLILCLSWY